VLVFDALQVIDKLGVTRSHMPHPGYVLQRDALPQGFPTHRHPPEFWESLGRTVATFSFLEDALCKAIFSLSATTHYSEDEIDGAYKAWLPTLERALADPLGNLICVYGKVLRKNQSANVENLDKLLADLRSASTLRNVICHGSWAPPDSNGATVPSFVNRQGDVFQTPIDASFLAQLRRSAADLACAVIDTVTHMGWQFPGSNGPGEKIWTARR
jgi:hypothetical protein